MKPVNERTSVIARCLSGYQWQSEILPGSTMPQTSECPVCGMTMSSVDSLHADYDFVAISPRTVMATSGGLYRFAHKWPCSGFPEDVCVTFEFASNGDLVDINWHSAETGCDIAEPNGVDGSALLALSEDAQSFLASD